MADFPYVHAQAELCSAPAIERGRQVVRYRGDLYAIAGLYFARAQNPDGFEGAERRLYYILKPFLLDPTAVAGISDGAP